MSDSPPPGWDGPPPPPQPYGQQPAPIWPAADPPAAPPSSWPGAGVPPGSSPFGRQQAPPPYGYVAYNPYGTSGPGNMRSHPRGTMVLVFGILGLCGVACCILLPFGIAAWVIGQSAMNEIRADPTTICTNRGTVNAGRICGIVATCVAAGLLALFGLGMLL